MVDVQVVHLELIVLMNDEIIFVDLHHHHHAPDPKRRQNLSKTTEKL